MAADEGAVPGRCLGVAVDNGLLLLWWRWISCAWRPARPVPSGTEKALCGGYPWEPQAEYQEDGGGAEEER